MIYFGMLIKSALNPFKDVKFELFHEIVEGYKFKSQDKGPGVQLGLVEDVADAAALPQSVHQRVEEALREVVAHRLPVIVHKVLRELGPEQQLLGMQACPQSELDWNILTYIQ